MSNIKKHNTTFLDKLANFFGAEAWEKVDETVATLDGFQDKGLINRQEHDALRHYLGIQRLAEHYGGTVAWMIGIANEGLDMLIPGQAGEQSRIDRINNNTALDHMKKGVSVKIEDLDSRDKIEDLLNTLEIPPPLFGEDHYKPPQ
tara:strand:+ start:929 stop:1366 length:438 start_codon:yes stop_codon:yes gene_type:complete